MNLPEITYCPSTLRPGFDTYSPAGQLDLFGSRARKVSHVLPFGPPGKYSAQERSYDNSVKGLSVSGAHEKYGLLQTKNDLALVGPHGTHILKPVPATNLALRGDMPANEHVTMQIARQVFGIHTAANGLIFFDDGSPAYITRRFDFDSNRTKIHVADFAAIMGKSREGEGHDFKYNASYKQIAQLISEYVKASRLELIKFFRLVVFNYLFANGDAHLKNFSLIKGEDGEYLLAPAYDLMCTALHLNDADLALHGGLYEGDIDEPSFSKYGIYTGQSFRLFGEMIGVPSGIAHEIIGDISKLSLLAIEIIDRSFLSNEAKEKYRQIIWERHRRFLLA